MAGTLRRGSPRSSSLVGAQARIAKGPKSSLQAVRSTRRIFSGMRILLSVQGAKPMPGIMAAFICGSIMGGASHCISGGTFLGCKACGTVRGASNRAALV